ncbi:HNH endonuclease family protein [Paraburkholderia antibiotica]|uniref:hypothetical protein n=1 Tax=Paraburkholderia antibiotica TaxID=2728839 RepID=UPI002E317604|nr:hypothetical protein [Paraburkholderia antibiotica]
MQCAAQLSTNDPDYATALASQQRGAGYITEQNDLKATGLFVYSPYDALNDPLAAMGDWGVQQVESAGRGAANMGNQLVGIIKANSGQTPPSDPNNELLGENDGNPPNTGASPVTPAVPVCDPPVCTMIPGSPGTAGYGAGNTTFNSGDGDQSASNGASGNGPYSNLTDSSSVGAGKNFTKTQKNNIYEQNMANNGGVLRSDVDGTELVMPSKSQSGVTPPSNEAQIDHIVPKNPADPNTTQGTNSYSNAQVLSRTQNRQKSNK